ncbi:MAG: hypothetical protein SVS15_00255 [Thermodesulfobacteriota bacterium]|nr:hypothetical protein [Thermodesulfobacteriota bacterium]
MKHLTGRKFPFMAAFGAGLAATVGQVVVLRELLVLFSGFELAAGVVLASWLFWTAVGSGCAGRLLKHRVPTLEALALTLVPLALMFPATLILVRAAHPLWGIGLGEFPTFLQMLGVCFVCVAPLCLMSGYVFSATWAAAAGTDNAKPIKVYLAEGMGAAVGGLVLYFILFPLLSMLLATLAVSAFLLALAGVLVFFGPARGGTGAKILFFMAAGTMAALCFFASGLEKKTRTWQWGPDVLTVLDTPYQNLAATRTEGRITVFAGGVWHFTQNDPATAEHAVHLALLQQHKPRDVLLVGGNPYGMGREILKHPSVQSLDFVDQDPGLVDLARRLLPDAAVANDPRLTLFHEDAALFVRSARKKYDVVLMNLGDPVSAQGNRFFTREFFGRIQGILKPAGLFSFAAASSPDALGPLQVRHLRTVYATLKSAFGFVAAYPGEQARFFASNAPGLFVREPETLIQRIQARNLDLTYVREYYLFDFLSPFRLDALDGVLKAETQPPAPVNQDFEPACYLNSLLLWGLQLDSGLKTGLLWLSNASPLGFWAFAAGVSLLIAFLFGKRRTFRPAVMAGVFVVGGAGIALEIVLFLSFQILAGNLYSQLALIIAAFMAGLALGAGLGTRDSSSNPDPRRALSRLILVQALVCASLAGIMPLLYLLNTLEFQSVFCLSLIFSGLGLLFGTLGGLQFALAVKALAGLKVPDAGMGGGLYAVDLLGSMLFSLLVSLVLIPIFGFSQAFAALTLICAGSLAALCMSAKKIA